MTPRRRAALVGMALVVGAGAAAAGAVLPGGPGPSVQRVRVADSTPASPSDTPTADPTTAGSPTPSSPASTAPVDGSPTPTATAAADYLGRVVDEHGSPVAGLYVYVGDPFVERNLPRTDPVARTAADGTFTVACPDGHAVLITGTPLHGVAGSLPDPALNYAYRHAEGTAAGEPAACTGTPEVTVVHPGAILTGTFHWPPGTDRVQSGWPGFDLRPVATPGATFGAWVGESRYRFVGLPPGDYELSDEYTPNVPIHLAAGATTEQDWYEGYGGGLHPAPKPTATFGSWTGVMPSLIYFSGDSGNIVHDITWKAWDGRFGLGEGTWSYDDCVPDCADGTVTEYPATLELSAPVDGQFTTITEKQTGPHGHTFTWTLPDPSLGARP